MNRSLRTAFLMLIIICSCYISTHTAFAQDLSAFEIIDNESVGLTVTPYEKFGMAVSDIDRNGYPDIFCLRWKTPSYSRIFTNQNGQFLDITSQSPLEQIEEEGQNTNTRTCLWVDYDNDGDRDLAMSTNKGIYLLRNDDNVFTDVSVATGFIGQIPPGFINSWVFTIGGWADYDLDGDLDCIIGQENNDNVYLFRNDDGVFTDAATEAGLDDSALAGSSRLSWFDFDLDGDPDIYSSYNFYRNDNGVFTDVTEEIGLGSLENVSYRDMLDYDNDGDFDFFKVVGSATDPATNEMWENQDGVFVNVTVDVGLSIDRDRYRSMTTGDCDNDGDVDIFVQLNIDPSLDVLLVNDLLGPGERAFTDVAEFIGITKTGDRKGCVFFDYDRDGALDIYLPSAAHNHILYRNLGDNGANWVGFILEGTVSNRDAVGSLVTIYAGDKKQVRYTQCGNGFTRQDNPWVHFGIGFDTAIDSAVIRWPLGNKQVLTDVAINQYHETKEPDGVAVDQSPVNSGIPGSFALHQNYPNPFNPGTQFTYEIPRNSNVKLVIYDILGHEVATLVDAYQSAGIYVASWDGKNDAGNFQSAGIYLYSMENNGHKLTRKMVFAK